jgi:hypothetical protein
VDDATLAGYTFVVDGSVLTATYTVNQRTTHVATVTCAAEASGCLVGPAVFKTVEGTKVPWRVRFPSASANARHIRVFRVLPSSSTTAPEPFGARSGRDRGAGESLEPRSGRVCRGAVAAT